jgi:hypothetical protein
MLLVGTYTGNKKKKQKVETQPFKIKRGIKS